VPIGVELCVARHLVVVAEIEPECLFRSSYFCCVLSPVLSPVFSLDKRNGRKHQQSETRQERSSVEEFGEPARQPPRLPLRPGTTGASAGVRGLRGR
jgi:hypothetical protein